MGRRKKREKGKVKQDVVSALQLPKDMMFGAVILSAVGRNELYIENYQGIIIYTDKLVKLQTKGCRVVIEGQRLVIEYYTIDEMKIVGTISGIWYE